jgi:hypothetical protein
MGLFKHYAYAYLALHTLIDLILAVKMYHRLGTLAPSFGFMFACCVLSLFLYFGVRNEELPGRNGVRVNIWGDPVAYWIGFALLVLSHLIFTVTMAL